MFLYTIHTYVCVIWQNNHVKVMPHINIVKFAILTKTAICCTCNAGIQSVTGCGSEFVGGESQVV